MVISVISFSCVASCAHDLAGHPALAHGDDAVRQRQHFRQFGRNHDDGDAGARHLEQQIVHLDLGADIDAARRLVDDQHAGPQRQPARQHHLLLVAAGEVADDLVRRGHADVEELAVFLDQLVFLGIADEDAERADPVMRGDREIGADGERQEQRLLLAVLRHEADAVGNRIARAGHADLAALDQHGA